MAITSKRTINVLGLNTQGFKSNSAYVSSLLKTNDVIFLSEHWLCNAEKYLISNVANPTHNVYFNAAEKHMMGRPYGGNCFMIHKDLTKKHISGYKSFFTEHNNNIKKVWEGIKEIVSIKSKNINNPTSIQVNNSIITDPIVICNNFNDYFVI